MEPPNPFEEVILIKVELINENSYPPFETLIIDPLKKELIFEKKLSLTDIEWSFSASMKEPSFLIFIFLIDELEIIMFSKLEVIKLNEFRVIS